MIRRTKRARGISLLSVTLAGMLALAACGGDDGDDTSTEGGGGGGGGEDIAISLITKDSTNPFFVAMQEGAEEAADAKGIDITIASGKEEGDDQGQIDAIEAAITAQQQGILITPMSTGVNDAIQRARDEGLFVIALDTPPDPPETVDITFATDNRKAGNLIGEYAAAQLGGEKAVIALLDIFDDKVVSVDYNRDQGFLEGMGIQDIGDPKINGDEPKTGSYSGGEYEIVGNVATGANEEGGRTGMEQLLSKNSDINVVYTINEPTAAGATAALEAAGKSLDDVIVVSVDGGRAGVEAVENGSIDATSQQYPAKMVELGVDAIIEIVETGEKPENSPGLDFFDTGVTLIAKVPAEGVESEDPQYGLDNAWG
ncbi:MAG TPA: substrate-binding domain-containing protein [Actinomycetes bacterium]